MFVPDNTKVKILASVVTLTIFLNSMLILLNLAPNSTPCLIRLFNNTNLHWLKLSNVIVLGKTILFAQKKRKDTILKNKGMEK